MNLIALNERDLARRLRIILLLAAAALGFLHAWIYRDDIRDLDGIAYLEMGEAYWRGDWATAINGYWSPLYAWLLGLAWLVLEPAPAWEYSVFQIVNLVVYLGALGCFDFLLGEVVLSQRVRVVKFATRGRVLLPEWAWPALGYPLFIWSSLYWIFSWLQCPDMALAGFLYLAAGLLLRIRRGANGWLTFAALGAVLGLGYLTKAAMFPLAGICLLVSLFSVADWRRGLPRVLIALAAFLVLAGPLVLVLSVAKGRMTVGDSARLNYAWFVKQFGIRHWPHWQGEDAGSGTPVHPARKLLDEPVIYEFRTPVGGTYPIWHDPSYWCDGIDASFDAQKQLWRLKGSMNFYLQFFFLDPQVVLILGLSVLWLVGGDPRLQAAGVLQQWNLLTPALAAMIMYSAWDRCV